MTEEEAKTKWCPMDRHVADKVLRESADGTFTVLQRSSAITNQNSRCVGSACMMFRTKYPLMNISARDQECYCGLAGKP